MAAAKKLQADNDGDERVDLFIAPYQSQYSEALTAAREAADTTATHAWQSAYKNNLDQHRSLVKAAIVQIETVCDIIESNDTHEQAEKDIGKAVKSMAEERVRFNAWRSRAVQPYEVAAVHCQDILHNVMRAASDSERDNPLIDHGIVAKVQERIAQWPRAEWDDENGVVRMTERPATPSVG
jgi:hypothetical protein